MASEIWKEACAKQQAFRDSTIPKEWLIKLLPPKDQANVMSIPYTSGIMSSTELALTEKDATDLATDLLRGLASGEISSYALTLAFCKRAAIAQQLVNCLTEMFVDEALARARELDDYFALTGRTVGPYHGLPFSIKDQWAMKGKTSSTGLAIWANTKENEDCNIVKILRDAGAVFYVKTTQPQTGMHLETVSNVYGRTLNPFNRNLTSGGSSGGEGALVAFRGSPIGLGADIGGSIRSPASCNGLFGAKITSHRIPLKGIVHSMHGAEGVPCTTGPICRSMRDNEYFMKTVLATEPWRNSHDLVPLPWREPTLPEKLTIGFIFDDGVVKPHPPITSALHNLKEKLNALPQFDVVDLKPFDHARGYDIVRQLYFVDGGKDNRKLMQETGEPVLPLSEWVMKDSHVKERTIPDLWKLNTERDIYRAQYAAYWDTHPTIDFIITPVGPSAAPRHDTARYWGYTAVWNILDWPACVFPSGELCSPQLHPEDTTYQPRENEFDAYNWGNYDAGKFKGAPIGFQLVGRKWDDEKVMKAVERIATVLDIKAAGSR